jgi:UDP-GlcNAc:undecaprenyl-phosphate/decaprenyl-phosphate GlcNAc-1-phosphate transferase
VTSALVAFAVSAALAAGFTLVPPMRRILLRSAVGARWRLDAVPVSGGLAMGAGFAAAAGPSWGDPTVRAVLIAGAVGLGWGLLDDAITLRPLTKVAGQVTAGLALVAGGVRLPTGGVEVVEAALTVAWVVVVANAFNLLDGMDGAAAGVGAVAAGAVWWWWSTGDGGLPTVLPAAMLGALAGFLVFNVRPARLFMGDSGATWLGVVAAAATVVDGGRVGSVVPSSPILAVAVGVVLLAVPLFDTGLVTVERFRHHRPLTQGGLDHTAHRLVAGGLSPAVAVALLWGYAAAAAAAASSLRVGVAWFAGAAVLVASGFAGLARHVARVEVYE